MVGRYTHRLVAALAAAAAMTAVTTGILGGTAANASPASSQGAVEAACVSGDTGVDPCGGNDSISPNTKPC